MSPSSSSDPKPDSRPRARAPGNVGLRRLIEAKRAGNAPIAPTLIRRGFRGWHERGYLPNFDAPHITQFVTFMLADSFPIKRRAEWEPILQEADDSARRRKLEAWLDRGMGDCWLRHPQVSAMTEDVLRRLDGDLYQLQAWVVMPNHVHLVVEVRDTPLSQLIKRWKGATAREANRILGRTGSFWQEDYFDTWVRDARHLSRAIRYVEQNPTKAKLVRTPREWAHSSARLRDAFERLPWQQSPVTDGE